MPTRIVFGPGRFEDLSTHTVPLGTRPLIVTGRRSARKAGLIDRALAMLPDAVVFDAVEENPGLAVCDRGAQVCQDSSCDVVVALGGGSPMDAAKAIAALALRTDSCAELLADGSYDGQALPVVAVPTTAGTGSETTPYAVLVNDARKKQTLRGIFPSVALLDPQLTVSMPSSVTANTGLDALSQAMEGMVSRRSTPMGDIYALEICRLLRRWLPVAVADGHDLEARSHVMYAAMLSGCVIAQSGTTLVHGMGYYLTVECGVPHGLANALLLTPVFQFNALHQPEKVAALADALGYPSESELETIQESVGEAIHTLMLECGISPAASQSGVDGARLNEFARDICQDASRFKNQLGVLTEAEVSRFYEASHQGVFLKFQV